MQWNLLVGPIIGAVIGYATNKIAVNMLFRPLKPIYIGTFHVPFTPGIIPKGKDRLGKAIGDAVGNNLLTSAVIKETLLSEEIVNEIDKSLDLIIQNLSSDDSTIESKIESILSKTTSLHLEDDIIHAVTQKINNGLIAMNLGETIAGEVMSVVQEKVQGTIFSIFVKSSTLAPIEDEIKIRVNQYIEEHGEEKVGSFIQEEYGHVKERSIASFIQNMNTTELKQHILNLYRMLITNYAEKFLSTLNLSKIVEEKVCAMSTIEVEKLVLSIMKKELGAVVNLGAIIGFILGLLNLIF